MRRVVPISPCPGSTWVAPASARASRVTLEVVPGALISISLYPKRVNVSGRPTQSFEIWRWPERAARGVEQQRQEGRYPCEAAARKLIQSRSDGDDLSSGKAAFVPTAELIVLATDAGEERLLSSQSLSSSGCLSRFFGIEDHPPSRREPGRAVSLSF
jgi:hypothetical protein